MSEELENQQHLLSNESIPELQLIFTLKPEMDRRRYNIQRINEVAAVFSTTADGEIPESYVTIRNKNTKTLQSVSTMDPNVEPWIYPLFYPYGTQGWHCHLKKLNSNRRITRGQYIKHRMAIRDDFNVFLLGRRLFQQWLVDNYVKIEKDRMNFCRAHQKELRSETYQGLIDYMQNMANNLNGHIGKMVILPSTFIGSPRNMLQNYQDAMAIVAKFGKPDLFITMTCNPKWREIEENLLYDQQASDRPDICTQIPDPTENCNLHNIVMKHMIHGPCANWCLVNGQCSKRYPRNFLEETKMDEDGYPYYRRRNTGTTFERPGGYTVDNRNVVPYCPILSIIFNCHINVEIVSSIKSVKYLYKYIYKGHDAAAITIEPITNNTVINHDEIHDYIEARYVGPVEASWRILGKKLQDKSHSIIRLPVHLPNEQNVIIENDSIEEAMTTAVNQVTMLIDYFALNLRDTEARKYLYTEIPHYYTFKKEKINGKNVSHWVKRHNYFNCIGRMYSVSPTQIELFHLRLLLLTIKGATSFNNLRTVNGETYQTFSETCLALGLIEDDDEWIRAMNEAVEWMMPRQLRKLFVRILLHCQPLHPEQLWKSFKVAISEDYIRHLGTLQGQRKAYEQINAMLLAEGKSFADFPQMEQLAENNEEEDYVTLEQAMEIDVFIWDEAPMAPRYALDIMDRTLRDIMNNDLPFGGKIVILGGDFRQLLSIKVREMGDGKLNDSNDNIQIPECCIAPSDADIVTDIYGDLIQKRDFNKIAKCAILSARNIDVDEINKRVVELLNVTEERIYTSVDSAVNCGDNGDI
ncbi:uncharacterized protein LOC118648518, partial [Monomorium pharaonis]|uniref:uncharacterized protein LOC118648518 n=1 Tax=Monomorium pharaonis TaxID=307658 RepID=UPI00174662D6